MPNPAPSFVSLFNTAYNEYKKGNVHRCKDMLIELHAIEPQKGLIASGIAKMYRVLAEKEKSAKIEYLIQALSWGRCAISEHPTHATYYAELGGTYYMLEDYVEMTALYKKALNKDINNIEANLNTAQYLSDIGDFTTAEKLYRKVLRLKIDQAQAHEGLAYILLSTGRYQEGFNEYEWRKVSHSDLYQEQFNWPWPEWRGEPLAGKKLYIRTEQGFGDNIKFARYINFCISNGAIVTIHTDPRLERFFQVVFSDCRVVSGQVEFEAKEQDYWVYLLSIPSRFKGIPTYTPYMAMPPMEGFEHNLKPKIGLVWKGNPDNPKDEDRSATYMHFDKLISDRFQFYSLQLPPETFLHKDVIDCSPFIFDWLDTAAIVSAMDLIISVDTSVAHLAGAMAKPVWCLLSTNPGWHYPACGDENPWYGSMTLFRQASRGDWESVIQKVAYRLANYPHVPFAQQVGSIVI